MPATAGGAPRHPEAGAGAAEEAERGDAGEGHAEDRAQQGRPGSQQAGESVPGAAETQPLAQGTGKRWADGRINTSTYCRQYCFNYVIWLLVLIVTIILAVIFENLSIYH